MQLPEKIVFYTKTIKKIIHHPVAPQSFVRNFIIAFFFLLALWGVFVLAIDPYIYYHRAWGLKNVFANSRAMVPGVLRNFEFDTVLLGSSMCQNFKCSEINEALQCKSVKATTAGITSANCGKYIGTALRYHRQELNRILVGIDIWSFAKGKEHSMNSYDYLYKDSIFPVKYFYSKDTADAVFEMILTNIAANFDEIARHEINEDVMFSNKPRYKYDRAHLERDVRKIKEGPAALDSECAHRFEKYILSYVCDNPQIKFDFFFPPYSIYFWCFLQSKGMLQSYLDTRNLFAQMAAQYPNVRLHDFQADFDIVCVFDNYKDITHYSPAINTLMIKNIGTGRNVCTLEDFKKNTDKIRTRSTQYQAAFNELRRQNTTVR